MSAGIAVCRRIGWGASGSMAVAAVIGLTAATASAATPIEIATPPGGLVVGVRTTVGASVSASPLFDLPWDLVTFRDNGTCFASAYPGELNHLNNYWTPVTAGAHTLTVQQGPNQLGSQTVTVAPAPAGAPAPVPDISGCKGGGSFGTGSLGF
ncbi:hypothetical protein ACFXHA_11215 [Nocardia sp. NPDC059240]|uniref:hypothetical protein n=1 Tax=Nocardia sp. NPDC059240 TaxID=3346786 RepID=UPI0036ACE496